MSRFYIPQESIKGDNAVVDGKEARHIIDVMRLKKGDLIEAFDGEGNIYQGRICQIKGKILSLKIEKRAKEFAGKKAKVSLFQAVPKKNKMEHIIEKAVELGVDEIYPVVTSRTIVRLDDKRAEQRHSRWQRIALEAAKQCGRGSVPDLKKTISFAGVLPFLAKFDLKLIACLSADTKAIKTVLEKSADKKNTALLIGPEGDFTPEEIKQAVGAGCAAVSLGRLVLKCDTAALAALAMINYELMSG